MTELVHLASMQEREQPDHINARTQMNMKCTVIDFKYSRLTSTMPLAVKWGFAAKATKLSPARSSSAILRNNEYILKSPVISTLTRRCEGDARSIEELTEAAAT